MFAVIKTGGKQYKVAPGDTLFVEKLPGEAGEIVALDQVLMLCDDKGTTVGTPLVEGATVAAEVVAAFLARPSERPDPACLKEISPPDFAARSEQPPSTFYPR